MSRWIKVDEDINQYICDHLTPEHAVLQELHKKTSVMEGARMQISHEQAQFMSVLLKSIRAKHTIEIGVFTGYSTLITALALPSDGRIIACDISEEWTNIAKPFWSAAGVSEKIDLRLAPATETLSELIKSGGAGQYDFAFIDADKTAYDDYYELTLELLRPGGLIALDNCLWGGAVIDESDQDADTKALRKLNDKISQDRRVQAYLAPVGDGVYLVTKL